MSRALPRSRRVLAALFAATGLAFVFMSGCQLGRDAEPPPPPTPCQPGTCPPGQWPTMPPPSPDPSPTAPPPGLMPAFVGFPCQATEDLICGWGKCIAGRCGGCQTNLDCKLGGACGWTPIGMACVYGGANIPR
ncbi:MAG: hypothetical protein IPK82_05480 [Polyangiaceae bacterium]|nr:hypothetical protein [Polyangiaceae bacterium]